jgi:hypothetical protein
MKKQLKKQKQKEQIFSLAEDANSKIIKNRIILSQINNYNKYIEFIKSFMKKCSEKNKLQDKSKTNISNISTIKNELNNLKSKIKTNNEMLKSEIDKLGQKYE